VPENQSKPWWQSKTIVSALGILLVTLFSFAGLDLSAADGEGLAAALVSIVTSGLAVVAIIGRITATKKID
jgi:hypothetical protein